MGLTEKLILPYIQEIEWNARNSVWVFPFLNLQMVFFLRIVEDSDERLLYHKCCSKNIQTRSIVFCQQLIFN